MTVSAAIRRRDERTTSSVERGHRLRPGRREAPGPTARLLLADVGLLVDAVTRAGVQPNPDETLPEQLRVAVGHLDEVMRQMREAAFAPEPTPAPVPVAVVQPVPAVLSGPVVTPTPLRPVTRHPRSRQVAAALAG